MNLEAHLPALQLVVPLLSVPVVMLLKPRGFAWAAPTAGLHFTPTLLKAIKEALVAISQLASLGTVLLDAFLVLEQSQKYMFSIDIFRFQGTGFLPGATVTLKKSGQSDIAATNVTVVSARATSGGINVLETDGDPADARADDGLRVGHRLEVFRDNAYLGYAVVLKTDPDRAVAQVDEKSQRGLVKVRDRVATKLSRTATS